MPPVDPTPTPSQNPPAVSSAIATRLALDGLTPEELRAQKSEVQLWVLLRDFTFTLPELGAFTVPAGFTSDLASVPRLTKALIDDDDPAILGPSVVHDWLYSLRGVLPDGRVLSREQADCFLRAGMLACGASAWRAWLVYRAVRLGGGAHWRE